MEPIPWPGVVAHIGITERRQTEGRRDVRENALDVWSVGVRTQPPGYGTVEPDGCGVGIRRFQRRGMLALPGVAWRRLRIVWVDDLAKATCAFYGTGVEARECPRADNS